MRVGEYLGIELNRVELRGPRVVLRPWRAGDAAAVTESLEPASMRRYLSVPSPYTREDAEHFVTEFAHRTQAAGTGLEVAIAHGETGAVLGSAAIRLPPGMLRSADIGYWVAPQAQGHGYAAEAIRVLGDWALSLGIARVEVRCEPTNLASARSALNAGHGFESYRRDEIVIGDRPRDTAVFVRTAGEASTPVPHSFVSLPADGLTDGVIRLRATVAEDTPGIIETEADPVTIAVGFSAEGMTADSVRRSSERAGLDWLVGGLARMTVVDVETGQVAGTIQLRKPGPPDIAGIGYGVHPGFRGRGYTARALRLLTPWAFGQGRFARLELGAKRDNVASQRAAISGGFEPDGIRAARLRNPDGTFSDEVRFALVAPHLRESR